MAFNQSWALATTRQYRESKQLSIVAKCTNIVALSLSQRTIVANSRQEANKLRIKTNLLGQLRWVSGGLSFWLDLRSRFKIQLLCLTYHFEALILCRVVVVAKRKNCPQPSSGVNDTAEFFAHAKFYRIKNCMHTRRNRIMKRWYSKKYHDTVPIYVEGAKENRFFSAKNCLTCSE